MIERLQAVSIDEAERGGEWILEVRLLEDSASDGECMEVDECALQDPASYIIRV